MYRNHSCNVNVFVRNKWIVTCKRGMNWKQIRFIESHNNRIFYQAKFERDFSLNRFETNNDIHILAMVSTYDRCIYDTLRISTPTFVHNSRAFLKVTRPPRKKFYSKRSPNFPPNGNKLCLSNKIRCVYVLTLRTIIDENLEILSHVWEGRCKNSDALIVHDDDGVIIAR